MSKMMPVAGKPLSASGILTGKTVLELTYILIYHSITSSFGKSLKF